MNLLEVNHLDVIFNAGKADEVQALRDVSLTLRKGEILGIVGESGSGKSTLIRTVMRLQTANKGEVLWKGEDVHQFSRQPLLDYRKQVQLIFQDPLDALNPRMTVAQIVAEPLMMLFRHLSKSEIRHRVSAMVRQMGLADEHLNRFPHEFSGGQCQRIGIARAMIVRPEMLVCDEPVSALDVSIQAQIINLLMSLREEMQVSMLFVSHDLGVVRHLCDRVLVLYKGQVVEVAETKVLFASPKHEYTQKLLDSIPLPDPQKERQRVGKCD